MTTTTDTRPLVAAVDRARSLRRGEKFSVTGLPGSSKAFFIARLFTGVQRPLFVVAPDAEAAEGLGRDLAFFLKEESVFILPETELLPFETEAVHPEILASRVEVLYRLIDSQDPLIVVTSARNLAEGLMPRESLIESVVYLKPGVEFPLEELRKRALESGYTKMSMVEERGEISVRGGILDIFPPMYNRPLRIEFFGDEVESIRSFDPSTQRSIERLDRCVILPATETVLPAEERERAEERLFKRREALGLSRRALEPLLDKLSSGGLHGVVSLLPVFYERLDTIFDYLKSDTILTLMDPGAVEAGLEEFYHEMEGAKERLASQKIFFADPEELYMERERLDASLKELPALEVEPLHVAGAVDAGGLSNRDITQDINLIRKDRPLSALAKRMKDWLNSGLSLYITAHNRGQAERTKELFEDYGLSPSLTTGPEILKTKAQGVSIAVGSLGSGFRMPSEALAIVTEEEIFGERVRRREPPSSKRAVPSLSDLGDLADGDYVVHRDHGIGIYRGLKRLTVEGVEKEFLLLEYRGGDKLYLPVQRLDLLGRYRGIEGVEPEVDRLGGTGWERRKRRVKKAVGRIAGELLKLYAARLVTEGHAFSGPDRLFREFEASFEYTETPDQARAIEECLRDMEAPRPMDRLVCGDVGYGKTEVAMRAAFKAVLDSKQVAVLVPTTVLAEQHYRTFRERFAPYPVVVESLSRFRTRSEQKDILERTASGAVDILIGTHRLLQNDVRFRDLGLIVIDEEHRFGVTHKEKLKAMRKEVDVLTLTATPIPRTLQMSIAGIRDLSIISTPPEDRLSIKTSIIRFDDQSIKEAIERELKRKGQVFFVHNRVQSIGAVKEFLERIVPEARIAVAHGQMKERELEERMLGFVRGEYDILLCTTIIESGLDIPTANTIIINRADRFGLAELYQLRGRVGRSRHRAYAYFITPNPATLTDEARKRMEVIQELVEPGSGFRVAAFDLEIRGAGELLGKDQSGQIAEVGFDLYTRLLEEAVREMKGEPPEEGPEPEINLRVSQYIPEDYIPDTSQRLNFYKRLASVRSSGELDYIEEELCDRYGEPPDCTRNLIEASELKLMLRQIKGRELTQKGARLYLTVDGDPSLAQRLVRLVERDPVRFRLTQDSKLVYIMKPDAPVMETARYILKELAG